mgnify:CR=1 FL=1
MNGACTELLQSFLVQAGAVALVTGKSITGVGGIQLLHEGIAAHFCEHGSCGNAERDAVTFGNALLWQ